MGSRQSKQPPVQSRSDSGLNEEGTASSSTYSSSSSSESLQKNEPQGNSPQPNEEQTSDSKCPMHKKDGTYSYDWLALFRPNFPHGPSGKKPMTEQEAKAKIARRASAMDSALASPGGGCPVQHREYNVYSQPLDPTNQMPQNPNQLPAPGQTEELSTHRVASNIPKGGASAGTTWTYPSAQMFYNALARKGKLGDTQESEMESVVALHNNMNEKTWKKVLEWEEATASEESPKLLRFLGRPQDMSPKAWLKHKLLGHPVPFDRHDWHVLRHDGTTVRYVIDYYFDESRAQDEGGGMPARDDSTATPSLLVDVRPALDSPQQLWDRAVTMPYAQWSHQCHYAYLPLWPTAAMKGQVKESVEVWKSIQQNAAGKGEQDDNAAAALTQDETNALIRDFRASVQACKDAQTRVDRCESDEECQRASLDLTICMGKGLCALQHAAFTSALTSDNNDDTNIQHALERLGECVVLKTTQHDELQRRKK